MAGAVLNYIKQLNHSPDHCRHGTDAPDCVFSNSLIRVKCARDMVS